MVETSAYKASKSFWPFRENPSAPEFDAANVEYLREEGLEVAYWDSYYLVLKKLPGMVSKKYAERNPYPCLESKVRQIFPDFVVAHRLDAMTSGLNAGIVTKAYRGFLQQQFAERKVKKIYTALVHGYMELAKPIEVDACLNTDDRKVRVSKTGKESHSTIHPVAHFESSDFGGTTVVAIELHTGRKHQARVHCYEVGHSIVGDSLYQGSKGAGQLLHATFLQANRVLQFTPMQLYSAPSWIPPEIEKDLRSTVHDIADSYPLIPEK